MDITAESRVFVRDLHGKGQVPQRGRKWALFTAWLLAVWVFVFVLAPWLQQVSSFQTLGAFVRDTGIEASALYYTEVAETSEAELVLRSTFEYGQFE